jgi:hypothetical protein
MPGPGVVALAFDLSSMLGDQGSIEFHDIIITSNDNELIGTFSMRAGTLALVRCTVHAITATALGAVLFVSGGGVATLVDCKVYSINSLGEKSSLFSVSEGHRKPIRSAMCSWMLGLSVDRQ